MADSTTLHLHVGPVPDEQRPFMARRRTRHQGERVGAARYVSIPTFDTRHLAWQEEAPCTQVDPECFFPEGMANPKIVAMCRSCPVAPECLAYALADPTLTGIWGGTGEQERKRIRRAAKRSAVA